MLGYLDISLGGSGLIGGERLAAQLPKSARQDVMIEDLPLQFAVIATEVGTGHEIWLTRGRLVDAMRASYALPGIFTPIRIGDRWLVDGALVNPVPVSAARALGARIVIAVNLNADLLGHGITIPATARDDERQRSTRNARSSRGADLRQCSRAERALKRQFIGSVGRPGSSDGDDRRLQHHAGPHHALAARRRSAGRADLAARRPDRLVRFPSRRGDHGAWPRGPASAPSNPSRRRSR